MRIGIDFDNTIACYDGVFHRAAVERGLIPAGIGTDKTNVRNHLRGIGREDDWTELQGHVYGARMDLVACYPGLAGFVRRALDEGHTLFVISHKTRHPYLGEKHDLHRAARNFLDAQRLVGAGSVPEQHAFFELTLGDKLARIAAQRCDVFIDDLPEFLAEAAFPDSTRAILFDPDDHYPDGVWKGRTFERHRTWASIAEAVLGRRG
jgi:hypothetical protein